MVMVTGLEPADDELVFVEEGEPPEETEVDEEAEDCLPEVDDEELPQAAKQMVAIVTPTVIPKAGW
ncbi:MAG TPA: hypothetical protein VKV06_02015 [Acidimicrobiales bacterium]|nr:hypothetical protein [Acidimicrobiales bacterium]